MRTAQLDHRALHAVSSACCCAFVGDQPQPSLDRLLLNFLGAAYRGLQVQLSEKCAACFIGFTNGHGGMSSVQPLLNKLSYAAYIHKCPATHLIRDEQAEPQRQVSGLVVLPMLADTTLEVVTDLLLRASQPSSTAEDFLQYWMRCAASCSIMGVMILHKQRPAVAAQPGLQNGLAQAAPGSIPRNVAAGVAAAAAAAVEDTQLVNGLLLAAYLGPMLLQTGQHVLEKQALQAGLLQEGLAHTYVAGKGLEPVMAGLQGGMFQACSSSDSAAISSNSDTQSLASADSIGPADSHGNMPLTLIAVEASGAFARSVEAVVSGNLALPERSMQLAIVLRDLTPAGLSGLSEAALGAAVDGVQELSATFQQLLSQLQGLQGEEEARAMHVLEACMLAIENWQRVCAAAPADLVQRIHHLQHARGPLAGPGRDWEIEPEVQDLDSEVWVASALEDEAEGDSNEVASSSSRLRRGIRAGNGVAGEMVTMCSGGPHRRRDDDTDNGYGLLSSNSAGVAQGGSGTDEGTDIVQQRGQQQANRRAGSMEEERSHAASEVATAAAMVAAGLLSSIEHPHAGAAFGVADAVQRSTSDTFGEASAAAGSLTAEAVDLPHAVFDHTFSVGDESHSADFLNVFAEGHEDLKKQGRPVMHLEVDETTLQYINEEVEAQFVDFLNTSAGLHEHSHSAWWLLALILAALGSMFYSAAITGVYAALCTPALLFLQIDSVLLAYFPSLWTGAGSSRAKEYELLRALLCGVVGCMWLPYNVRAAAVRMEGVQLAYYLGTMTVLFGVICSLMANFCRYKYVRYIASSIWGTLVATVILPLMLHWGGPFAPQQAGYCLAAAGALALCGLMGVRQGWCAEQAKRRRFEAAYSS